MAILADHVTRSVSITIFGIVVGALAQKGLEDRSVTSDTGNVKRCAHVFGFAVQMCSELSENFNHLNMTFITSNMEGSPAIRIALVKQSLSQLRVLFDQ